MGVAKWTVANDRSSTSLPFLSEVFLTLSSILNRLLQLNYFKVIVASADFMTAIYIVSTITGLYNNGLIEAVFDVCWLNIV